MTRSRTGFGEALERICSATGKSQKELASEMEVAPETASRWKTDFHPPSADLFRVLTVLRRYEPGLTAEDLVDPEASGSEA